MVLGILKDGGNATGTSAAAAPAAATVALVVDAATVRNGSLTAEVVVAATGQPLAGYTAADALPFAGDDGAAALAWRGGRTTIPLADVPGGTVQLRFFLLRARLYRFELRPAS